MVDDKLTRIENKIDKIHDRINAIDVTLAQQHESLVHHIKRTDLLENKIAPIEKQLILWQGAGKLVSWIAVIAAAIAGIAKILKFI